MQCLTYYTLGHIVVELRACLVPYACAFATEVLHDLLLRFDITQVRFQGKQERTLDDSSMVLVTLLYSWALLD